MGVLGRSSKHAPIISTTTIMETKVSVYRKEKAMEITREKVDKALETFSTVGVNWVGGSAIGLAAANMLKMYIPVAGPWSVAMRICGTIAVSMLGQTLGKAAATEFDAQSKMLLDTVQTALETGKKPATVVAE